MSVLVTGGGGGLGRAVLAGLAARGVAAAVVDIDGNGLADALDSARGAGVDVAGEVCDIGDDTAVARTWDALEEQVGAIEAVVNCAGSYAWRDLAEITPEAWAETLAANLTGPFIVCRHAGLAWIERGAPGAIVNVASTAAFASGFHEATDYGAAKAGLVGLTVHLAVKLGPRGIRANAIAPGSFRSPMNEARLTDPAEVSRSEAIVPLGRVASAAEVAAVALYLALDADYVTGTVVPVDGGTLARM